MATAKIRFLEWLRDAHAMEKQAERLLSGQAQRIKDYPELKGRMELHLHETRQHAEKLRGCIERHGASPSVLKDTAAKMVAVGQGLSGLFVGDEIVKASLASYTFEHMEIASYRILIAAAEEVGDTETRRVCEEICREEEAMAAWLAEHVPATTRKYLQRGLSPALKAAS